MTLGKICCDENSTKEEFIVEFKWFLNLNPDNPNNDKTLKDYIQNFDLEKTREWYNRCNKILYGRGN